MAGITIYIGQVGGKIYDPKAIFLAKNFARYYVSKTNRVFCADIAYNAHAENNIKYPPKLGHGINGIFIASGAIIGRNCFLSHQVTIGRSSGGALIIGDDVYIGPGAKIFGKIKIGNNVRIGANCVVFQDIPDNATVVLEKPRIIIKDANYKYFVVSSDE